MLVKTKETLSSGTATQILPGFIEDSGRYFETLFQEYVYVSRYSRFLHEMGRRETWSETVTRYFDFFTEHLHERCNYELPSVLRNELEQAVLNLDVMPSMRCLMSAGPALVRDEMAGFNCSYATIDNPKVFAEILYILMVGTGVGFSVERQHVNKLPEVPEDLFSTDTTVVIADSKIGWAKGLNELISILFTGYIPKIDYSKVRPAGSVLKTFGGRACLTGDTIVYRDRKKTRGYNEITIKELFDIQEREKNGKFKGRFNKIKLRSLNEETGMFFRNQLIGVVDNGQTDVYEVLTEQGYRIKATMNHRFMNSSGEYSLLEEFDEGDMIAVNGSSELKTGTCVECGISVSRRAIRCKKCYYENQKKEDCSRTTVRQRKGVRDYRNKHISCELCNVHEDIQKLEVHHIDGNPWNDDEENFLVVCPSCHRKEDMKRTLMGDAYSCRYLQYDKIISIRHVGIEKVYDLQMEGPNHNFIANGFVSHNSGPEPLKRCFDYIISTFKEAKGRKLTSLECHDIVCMIGECVVSGGVRRSATISLSNLSDDRMRSAKSGQWWNVAPWRSLANNSAVYNDKRPTMDVFMAEWKSLYDSKSGERGIFSRFAAKNVIERSNSFREEFCSDIEGVRYRETDFEWGCNPCSEIILRPNEVCNLTEIVVRENDTLETLLRKARVASILGTFQSTLTHYRFLSKKWRHNAEDERLLGVSLTGIMDNPVLAGENVVKLKEWLTQMRREVIKTNVELANDLNIPSSTASTCIKPSGTVSSLVDSSAGIHGRHSEFYIRTIRSDKKDPCAQVMIDAGIPHEDDLMRPDHNMVFSFPMKSPKSSQKRENSSAIDQLNFWLLYQMYWCDHKPSVTISVKDHEWMAVGSWVYDHFEYMSGVSFLPYADHIYSQAPYQEVTEKEYFEYLEKMPKEIDWKTLIKYESNDLTIGSQNFACTGDKDGGGGCDL